MAWRQPFSPWAALSQATDSAARAGRLESLLWQTWYFHEDEAARQLLRDGSDLLAEGDLDEAKKRFLHAAILEPGWAEAWNRLATVNYLLGFYDESLAEIDKTLEIVPRHFGALSGRGLVMLKLERYREAVEAFEDTQARRLICLSLFSTLGAYSIFAAGGEIASARSVTGLEPEGVSPSQGRGRGDPCWSLDIGPCVWVSGMPSFPTGMTDKSIMPSCT
ncbi:unnamed protein product [Symbiodinium necroappetens]|uniref:Tetratricopeptide repeat protein n=1 Tax=Symbiodinium necroappetens TaxID=1628268 RepID=A0A812ZNN8_9DINO|nr:unnamed protein product [Symbiodinium necroappetens]